ncbi:MAG TPA: SUF system NifU family Fe-S cluster assembly protein [Gemmatimonadaceae bacterium]|nr:SUF system NifU family Fe-S cluster assembly protein [Gemmatimonadaceae bacterium]
MPASDGPAPHLQALYQELILDHYRRPRNQGALEHPDAAIERRNPSCGDIIRLQVAFEDGVVRALRFAGQGCAISQASASMMTQVLQGKPREEVERLSRRFTAMIGGDADAATDRSLGDLRALAGVARLPSRHGCALLAWKALADALARQG